MAARERNERKFDRWWEMADGGRRYSLEVRGRHGWKARYVKEVDSDEKTIRFWQEVYDDAGRLVEIHHKYPIDRGHQHAQERGEPQP
jgi:hypothetical protein